MKSIIFHLLIVAVSITSMASAIAQGGFGSFGGGGGRVATRATLISEQSVIAPGQPFQVALRLEIADKWHAYYINPGLIGQHMNFKWELPEGYTASEIQWQTPHISEMFGMNTYSYSDTCYFPVTITPPATMEAGQKINLNLKARWQICDDQNCVNEPGRGKDGDYSTSVMTGENTAVNTNTADDFKSIVKHAPITSSDWKITATDVDKTITLNITPPAGVTLEQGNIYFYDRDGQVDAQAEQKLTKTDEGYTLAITRSEGNDFVTDPGPILEKLQGILSLNGGEKSITVSADFGANNSGMTDENATTANMAPVTLDGKTEKKLNIWSALGFAFLGGMILNLMPCVFPVLGLKIMGFVQQAGEDPRKIKIHGLVFGAGLLTSLWILAGVLIALITFGGKTFGWGFQLNDPVFLSAMIVLIFVLGLNLTGVFEMGTSLTGVGGELQSSKGYKGSFFSGVLTTLIATPCTGPFLGTTMGYTLQQPPFIALIIFTSLGLGIASPYILLSFFPALIKKLPRPGAWMETFKQVMAFPLYATVLFFLSGFGSLTGTSGLIWMLAALLIITIALWIYGRWYTPMKSKRARVLAVIFTLIFLALGTYTIKHALAQKNTATSTAAHDDELFEWEEWRPDVVSELQNKGHIVFMDYTADT